MFFINRLGNRLSSQSVRLLIKRCREETGIGKKITPHVARHTFATTITLANKVSLENVAKMMGHASTRMTQHYARVLDQTIMSDMEKVQILL